MKLIGRTISTLSLVVMLFAGWAQAQSQTKVMNVNIPFEFVVGNRAFPAGSYSIVRITPSILSLRNDHDGVISTMTTFFVEAARESASPKLQFETAEGRHVLVRVWFADTRFGNALVAPKHALEATKVEAHKQQAGMP